HRNLVGHLHAAGDRHALLDHLPLGAVIRYLHLARALLGLVLDVMHRPGALLALRLAHPHLVSLLHRPLHRDLDGVGFRLLAPVSDRDALGALLLPVGWHAHGDVTRLLARAAHQYLVAPLLLLGDAARDHCLHLADGRHRPAGPD